MRDENTSEFGASPASANGDRPFILIWEVTQACDLACVHCRACAQPQRSLSELTTSEGEDLIRQVRALKVPVFVLTGGDPLKRPDIYHLVEYGTSLGVRVSLSPSATPLLTRDALARLKACGLARLAISLDGSSAALHDRFRGVTGSYNRVLQAVGWAHELDLPVQVNSTMTRHNVNDFDALAKLMEGLDVVLWSVFFLVPTGRGKTEDLLSGDEFEKLFEKLYQLSTRVSFDVKTTEAMHYRRFFSQRRACEKRVDPASAAQRPRGPLWLKSSVLSQPSPDGIPRATRGINDAKGFVFVSHAGEVYPSGFLPLSGGNIRQAPLAEIYREAPLFVALRNPDNLKGKCGVCEYREICGGSRARSYALTGDPFSPEPCCIYQPKQWMAAKPGSFHASEAVQPPAA
ncbi:MAG TPA: TIGR04053 family radical SAM/SPASM domain-containing protein [Terriglobia bacterium]|nr:TIGR04053 family radical SAM/SPASM domain-containing protein [Terriglobia bacterium]